MNAVGYAIGTYEIVKFNKGNFSEFFGKIKML